MMVVFLVGHGRMDRDTLHVLPRNCRLEFAVPSGFQGSPGVSKPIVAGRDSWYSDTFFGESSYPEHFLGGDGGTLKDRKDLAFCEGLYNGDASTYLMQMKLGYVARLSQIIGFLVRKANGAELEIVWTCCRSPIKGNPVGKWEMQPDSTIPRTKEAKRGLQSETGIESDEKEIALGVINEPDGFIEMVSGAQCKQFAQAARDRIKARGF